MAFGSHYLGNAYFGKGPSTLAVLVRTVVRAIAVFTGAARGVGSYFTQRSAVGVHIEKATGKGRG